jgi:hypothetical protein
VKPLEQPQKAVAEIGDGAIGDDDTLLSKQLGADLCALQIPQVARQTDLYDEIVAIPLSRGTRQESFLETSTGWVLSLPQRLRTSLATKGPAAKVTTRRRLLFCACTASPQSGQCSASATKSIQGMGS